VRLAVFLMAFGVKTDKVVAVLGVKARIGDVL
jgi:hypothetical protein